MVWLFLLLLGLTLYFIVQHSVVRVTHTPWWQLWLALMIPAFTIAGWSLTHKTVEEMPTPLLIGAFVVSIVLYVLLIGLNPRTIPPQNGPSASDSIPGTVATGETANALNQDEQAQLKNCFPWSVYYLQQIDLRPQAVICRGQLRTEPDVAYETIRKNVQTEFGDRFLVLFQTGISKQPFFALVSNPYIKPQGSQRMNPLPHPGFALGLLVLTLLTTAMTGLRLADPTLDANTFFTGPQVLLKGLPYAIALVAILGIHELGHYFAAQFYKIQTSLPYFIPIPALELFGTLGAYTQIRSPIPHRKSLFDLGIAGPIAGLAITLPILLWGLTQSDLVALSSKPGLLTESMNPRFSVAFALLSRLTFGQALTLKSGIHLHPVAVAGMLGLLVIAFHLTPFGQMDGGRIVHAMFGQRTGVVIGQVSRIVVLLLSFTHPFLQTLLLFWGIYLLFMPAVDEPALNDVSELNNARDGLGLAALALFLLIILPVPMGLESWFFVANPTP